VHDSREKGGLGGANTPHKGEGGKDEPPAVGRGTS